MIKEPQKNPLLFETILLENKVLELHDQKQTLLKQLEDTKDLLRKYRQKLIPIQPSYTSSNGVFIKKSTKELYPVLEKNYAKLNKQKQQLNNLLVKELRKIVKMIKAQLIGKLQLDARVFAILNHYETNFEDELMQSDDDDQASN